MLSKVLFVAVALTQAFAFDLEKFSVTLKDPIVVETGMKGSTDIDVLRQAANEWFDTIIQVVNDLKIPDVDDGHGNYMHDNEFFIDQRIDGVTLDSDVANNALTLKCDKLTAKFKTNHFKYHVAPLINATGYAEIDMNTVQIGFGIQFNTQVNPTTGRQVLAIKTVDVTVNINKDDIKLHIGGGVWTDLASLFEVFFKGTVVDQIKSNIQKALTDTLPAIANKALLANNGFLDLGILVPHLNFDWESPNPAVEITNTTLGIATKGLFFDDRATEVDPTDIINYMPFKNDTMPNNPKFQAFASTFSIDGFFDAFIKVEPLDGWYNSTDVTTSLLNIALPGISKFYGDVPVMINFDAKKIANVKVTEANSLLDAQFTLDLNFWVKKTDGTVEQAASITLKDTDFAFNVDITEMTANMVINTIKVDKIVINSCTFGKLSPFTMKLKLNNGWRVAKGTVNKELAKHSITVPSKPTKYFEISDLSLDYYNNFIGIGVTPTFIGPSKEFTQWFIEEKESIEDQN